MPNGLLKFFGERTGADHGDKPIFWPGTPDGFPFRGTHAPTMTQAETEEQIDLVPDFHSQTFHLWVPEEKQRYDDIMDRILKGWYMKLNRTDKWVGDHDFPMIYLEWCQIYGEAQHGNRIPLGMDGHGQTIPLQNSPGSGGHAAQD